MAVRRKRKYYFFPIFNMALSTEERDQLFDEIFQKKRLFAVFKNTKVQKTHFDSGKHKFATFKNDFFYPGIKPNFQKNTFFKKTFSKKSVTFGCEKTRCMEFFLKALRAAVISQNRMSRFFVSISRNVFSIWAGCVLKISKWNRCPIIA